MSFALMAIVKATIVCALAFFLSHLCRHTRASIRHFVFALAFAALVAIPVAGPILPTVAISLPIETTVDTLRTDDIGSSVPSTPGANLSESRISLAPRNAVPTFAPTIAHAVITAWLTGVAIFLMPVVVGLWQVRRLHKVASPWLEGQGLARALAPRVGVHRSIDVRVHELVLGPMTCGVLKPAIILPTTAQQWDEATITCALRHELEHVLRWDFLVHCLSRVVCAAYWFHPLVWAAWRRLRLEAERACDDAVLQDSDAPDYASLLVLTAQRSGGDKQRPILAMAGPSDLAARIAAVLDHHQERGRIGHTRAAALIALALTTIMGIAPLTVERAVAETQVNAAEASLRFESVSIRRNIGSGTPARIQMIDGEWVASNTTARSLLVTGYGPASGLIWPSQIENAPEWIDTDRFDIRAKPPLGATESRLYRTQMVQSMLTDRFTLAAHLESRELPVYALVLVREDGSPGPAMTPSQFDCSSTPGQSSPCGLSSTHGRLVGRGMTMARLVGLLDKHLHSSTQIVFDRQIVDRTQLDGAFDFTLEWIHDRVIRGGRPPHPSAPTLPLETTAPAFLTALEQQVGLRLESQLAPQPVLVIDRIEPPTED